MNKINKNIYVGIGAMLLFSFVGLATAQQDSFPTNCPNVTSLSAGPTANIPKTPERSASDKLVAEGLAATRNTTGETLAKAISLFEQAVRTDPKNPAAYIALARAHTQSQRYLSVPKKTAQTRAWENLSKARELDPANIDGLHLLADQIIANNRAYKCAEKILAAALKLDPQNARSNFYYSQLLSGMGKFDLAFKYADKSIAVAGPDSLDMVTVNAGRPRYMAGQYDWVLDHYAKYLESHPGNSLSHFYRSMAFGAEGKFEEALVEAKMSMPDAPKGDAGGIGMLALAYANAGQKDKARELLNELLRRDARAEAVVKYRIAVVYEVLGERDEAFRWMDKGIEDQNGLGSWLVWLNYDPAWNGARKDRRWKDIKKRAGW